MQPRGPVDTWYNNQFGPTPAVSSERLPAIQSHASGSSASSSPRGGSFSLGSASNGGAGSNTSYSASVNGRSGGFKTPSPEQAPKSIQRDQQQLHVQAPPEVLYGAQQSYDYSSAGYNSMNQMQSAYDAHQPHMSAASAHQPASAVPSTMSSHYSYPPQPALMQPGQQYSQGPSSYAAPYGYSNSVPSQIQSSTSMSNPLAAQPLPLPGMCYDDASFPPPSRPPH